MQLLNTAYLAAVLAAAAATGAQADTCRSGPGRVCRVIGNIQVHARSAERLEELRAPVAAAQGLFKRHFAAPVPAGALVDASSIPAGQRSMLMQAGLAWVLPWLDPQDTQAVLQSSIRAQLRAQMPDASESEIEASLAQSLAAIPAPSGSAPAGRASAAPPMLEGALQHEIGHQLFIHAYFDDAERAAAQSDAPVYGAADAPDWLDEAAAILTEDAAMAEGRRAAFARQMRKAGLPSLKPLAEYFAMPHPGIASAEVAALVGRQAAGEAGATDGTSGSQVAVIVVDDLAPGQRAGLEEEGDFYAMTRVFADFLLETSGDPAVFGRIAQAVRQQRDVAAWLAAADTGLPYRTLAALEAGWRAWVGKRYLAAASTTPAATGYPHR